MTKENMLEKTLKGVWKFIQKKAPVLTLCAHLAAMPLGAYAETGKESSQNLEEQKTSQEMQEPCDSYKTFNIPDKFRNYQDKPYTESTDSLTINLGENGTTKVDYKYLEYEIDKDSIVKEVYIKTEKETEFKPFEYIFKDNKENTLIIISDMAHIYRKGKNPEGLDCEDELERCVVDGRNMKY